jgi:ubiquitin-conjugating enzyme E2 C
MSSLTISVLQDKWSAVYSVHTVLVSLQSLLGDPNNASPLNVEAAELWADQEGTSRASRAVEGVKGGIDGC